VSECEDTQICPYSGVTVSCKLKTPSTWLDTEGKGGWWVIYYGDRNDIRGHSFQHPLLSPTRLKGQQISWETWTYCCVNYLTWCEGIHRVRLFVLKCPYYAFSDMTFHTWCVTMAVFECKRSAKCMIIGVIISQNELTVIPVSLPAST